MRIEELECQVEAALLDALVGNDAILSEETKAKMLERVIKFVPPAEPIQWVESAIIENGVMNIRLTKRGMELLMRRAILENME